MFENSNFTNDNETEFDVCLWAKKKTGQDGIFYWLPLKQHLVDTMNVISLLWEHWLSRGQREFIKRATTVDDEIVKNLCKFLGSIHDYGKATPAFQIKTNLFAISEDLDNQLLENLEKSGFYGLRNLKINKKLKDLDKTPHALASELLLIKHGINSDIASIVGAHHGKPSSEKYNLKKAQIEICRYENNYFQNSDENSDIYKKWELTQKNILLWALSQSDFEDINSIPNVKGTSAQFILNALLIMADWIASNERYFPLISIEDNSKYINQRERIEKGWLNWFKTFNWHSEKNISINDLYQKRFNFKPREIQRLFSEIIENTQNPGIFILEAPMGVGKTEAALIGVEQLNAKTGMSGMYFGLPTQATSNGIFTRMKVWLDNITKYFQNTMSVQLVHGKATLNDEFLELSKNIDIDGVGDVVVNQWFSGRKTRILDDFVIGTVDQFLLASLKKKHLMLKHLGFSKKVIVIDEVHAYDTFMSEYLYRSITWMASYGVPIIILSATLPSNKRKELIEAYVSGVNSDDMAIKYEKNWKTSNDYPLITYFADNEVKQISCFENTQDKIVDINYVLDDEKLINLLVDKLSDGGIAGIVVNTVKKSQILAKKLSNYFGDDLVELLHSAYLATDRVKKEKKLIEIIGKNATRPYKKIIIGTQVIEQSLDIDFDIMISQIAPMDLLIQRMGRLHRHKVVYRPIKIKNPEFYILGKNENFNFEDGSDYVYHKYLLIRTQMILPQKIKFPNDISPLVQNVYEEDKMDLCSNNLIGLKNAESMKEIYAKSKCDFENFNLNQISRTKSYIMSEPTKAEDACLNCILNNESIGNDELQIAQVRDSKQSIEVIIVKKYADGYSFVDENQDISTKIDEFEIGKKLATQTISLPRILSSDYNIYKTIDALEKFNNKELNAWQKQIWLKGSLGIILNENNSFELNGFKLSYSQKYGLEYEKEEKCE